MIITANQVKELTSYLASILKYQETVDEITDHILSSLEEIETDLSFSSVFLNIINKDFGGPEGLVLMEKQSQQLISKNLINKLNSHFWSYWKLPKVLHVVAMLAIFYYALSTYKFTIGFLVISCYLLASIPSIVYLMRYFFIGYYTGSTKKSVKDKTIARLGSRSLAMANAMVLCLGGELVKPQVSDFISSYPIVVSFIFVLLSVQVLSFIQLNETDFNKYINKSITN